jgi:glycosyltransferase involved in cell wall biosynthesis
MRVLFCYPWLDLGGGPKTSITLAKGLNERGHELFFFTKADGIYGERLRAADIPIIHAPHHPVLPHLYHLNRRAYRILSSALERHRIDIIHVFHFNSYFLSLFAALRRNIPVVYTVVWHPPEVRFPAYPGRIIFVADEFREKALTRFGQHPREMRVLPNRVDLDMYHPDVDCRDFTERHALSRSGVKIAFMSRIDRLKFNSIEYILEAVRLLAGRRDDVTLAIAGDGPRFEKLSRLVEELNRNTGRQTVRLLGPILETPQFIAWSDLFIGIGRSAMEGMAGGKPTLVVGEKGLAGVVEPETAAELRYYNLSGRNLKRTVQPSLMTEAVERIMRDRGEYDRLAAFARRYALEQYDYRPGAEELEKIYTSALMDPPLPAKKKLEVYLQNWMYGYGSQLLIALRLRARQLLGRGT